MGKHWTSINVDQDTKDRFDASIPEHWSDNSEWLNHILDIYQTTAGIEHGD